jgi:hypothetical protein
MIHILEISLLCIVNVNEEQNILVNNKNQFITEYVLHAKTENLSSEKNINSISVEE